MRAFFHKITQQDYESRKRWFAILTTSSCIIIFIIWILVIQILKVSPLASQEPEPEIHEASAFSTLLENMSDAWSRTKNSLSSAIVEFEKTATSSTETATTSEAIY